jgi:hypothetical protein
VCRKPHPCVARQKSRSAGGRPQIDAGLRALIRWMSVDDPLRCAPRIHGEPRRPAVHLALPPPSTVPVNTFVHTVGKFETRPSLSNVSRASD